MGAPKALRAVGCEFEVGRDEVSEENVPNICHEKIIKMERKLLFLHTKLLQFDLTISSTHSNYPRSLLSRRRVSALTALARLRT